MSFRRGCRRRYLLGALPVALLPAGYAWSQTPPLITTGGLPLGLDTVTAVTGQPVAVDYAPDGSDRLFVATRTNGQVRLFTNSSLHGTSFLNLATGGVTLSGGGEKGLLGVAFHPSFNAAPGTPGRGKFYTYTSEAKAAAVDYSHPELGGVNGAGGDHDSVFREWTVNLAAPDTVNYAVPSREFLRLRQPQGNHNGGAIRFDAGGYLYLSLGDGGGANDQHTDAGQMITNANDGHSSGGNSQDLTNVYGKILRIDPLAPADNPGSADAPSGNGKYRVPAANPFLAGSTNVDEIYAYGLRNPFQIAFDRGTGNLYAGDVGQGEREEVDLITSGGNYGWVNMEGTRTNTTTITDVNPIGEYTHSDGVAVIGGTVYRGNNIPELFGKYVFGELDGPGSTSGRLFYMDAPGGGTIREFTYAVSATHTVGAPASTLHSIGEDKNGELYATFANGNVARLMGRQWLSANNGSWNTAGDWIAGVPNAAGASANFLGRYGTGGLQRTITLDGNKTVGALRFNTTQGGGGLGNSFVVAPGSGGTLTINGAGGVALVHVIRGAHTVAAPLTFATSTNVNVAAGSTLSLTGDVTVNGGPLTVAKQGGGTVIVAGALTFLNGIAAAGISVTDGTFAFAPGGTARRYNLSITGGRLDLANNRMIGGGQVGTWNGSAYTAMTGLVAAGRNGGAWNGTGIVTSDTRAPGSGDLTTIGVASAADVFGLSPGQTANWLGQSVNHSHTLTMFTWGGDANLDGKIDIDDYGLIDSNVSKSGSVFGWNKGDFNYDGKINIDDYGIIDANINRQTGPLANAAGLDASAATSAVPEPAGVATLVLVGTLGLRRRRRRAGRLR